jgi:hypothetical protein
VLVALLLPSIALAAGPYPQTREGWLVGFGVGGGSAGLTADNVSSDREGGAAGSFRVGYAFQPQLSLELNTNGWTKEQDGVTVSFSVIAAALNFYPGAQGLVLRGGLGGGSGTAQVQVGSLVVKETKSGFGITAGAGYEFRVTRTFAVGPQVDFGWTSLDTFDANYINGCLGFNWYFIPNK